MELFEKATYLLDGQIQRLSNKASGIVLECAVPLFDSGLVPVVEGNPIEIEGVKAPPF
jgi:hypothetical protein